MGAFANNGNISVVKVVSGQDRFTNVLQFNVATPATGSNVQTRIENVKTLAGKKATLSFWTYGTNGAKVFDVKLRQFFGSGGSVLVDTPTQQVAMTYTDLQGLSSAILVRNQANFVHLQNLKGQVKQLPRRLG